MRIAVVGGTGKEGQGLAFGSQMEREEESERSADISVTRPIIKQSTGPFFWGCGRQRDGE
jgi:hypothetical protein